MTNFTIILLLIEKIGKKYIKIKIWIRKKHHIELIDLSCVNINDI